jgi:hypothetical protein
MELIRVLPPQHFGVDEVELDWCDGEELDVEGELDLVGVVGLRTMRTPST